MSPAAHVPRQLREHASAVRGGAAAPYVHAKLQAVQHELRDIGRYIISERPLTEEELARGRAIADG